MTTQAQIRRYSGLLSTGEVILHSRLNNEGTLLVDMTLSGGKVQQHISADGSMKTINLN